MLDKQQPRDYFSYRIQRNLIGPGADVLGLPDVEELLSQMPLQIYYSAILFPDKQTGYLENAENKPTFGKIADAAEQNSFDENDDGTEDLDNESLENSVLNTDSTTHSENPSIDTTNATEPTDREYVAANSYFPTNFGMTFCLAPDVKTVDLTFRAGVYEQLNNKAEHLPLKRVRIDRDAYFGLLNQPEFSLSDCLGYLEENGVGYAFFKERPPTNYRDILKQFKETHAIVFQKLDLLASTRLFKRNDLCETYPLSIVPSSTIHFPIFKQNEVTIAECWVKVVSTKRANYVKVLLQNTAEKHPADRFSNGNEDLNQKCLFQVSIEASAAIFESYKEPTGLSMFDDEANFLTYQYRNVRDYGIGHGCAVIGSPQSVATTFLPEVNIPAVSQDFRAENEGLKEIAQLRNLSVWSAFSQKEMTDKLAEFVEAYAVWVLQQEKTAKTENTDFQEVSDKIIDNQRNNLKRLRENVALLQTNTKVFDCFRLANTAMLLQMVTSRDDRFGKKEKHLTDFEGIKNPVDCDSLAFFEHERYNTEGVSSEEYAYRPFQLAFLILNLESMIDPTHLDRLESVDLIWFPTGGGKTEAYLALTAFTIFWRRLQYPKACDGVSVIMRYTLRLLTAQQFERAARLICALEFMRRHKSALPSSVRNYAFGSKPITIGMWVGSATTPNKLTDAAAKIEKIEKEIRELNTAKIESTDKVDGKNPFPITACPFCGCRLITRNKRGILPSGFSIERGRFKVVCKNGNCAFGKNTEGGIPLDVVDESLYQNPPTLLFATVDKFAQIAHRPEAHAFFNSINTDDLPPDLIIQDELHLLNGPLGSVVGLFETVVELLSSRPDGRKPKIIASTATTRNTDEQIRGLYGANRRVNIFPPSGIEYSDSYFSRIIDTDKDGKSASRRRHIGFMPTGKTGVDAQVRAMIPALLMARLEIYRDSLQFAEGDERKNDWKNYWTIVSYYNSLKDVGKTYNKVADEILTEIKKLHTRHGLRNPMFDFNHKGLLDRTSELTSRIPSNQIKTALKMLESKPILYKYMDAKSVERWGVKDVTDLVLVSNMFSVGIDIGRLNVMLMNGQPKNIAEYIQASSRVARNTEGVVINLLDANRAREKSYFEHYVPFHQAYYRFVEPLTVTPFTEITFDKALKSLLVIYVRHIQGLNKDKEAHDFQGNITDLVQKIIERIPDSNAEMRGEAEQILSNLTTDWLQIIADRVVGNDTLTYKSLFEKRDWQLMNSMRETDTSSLIEVEIDSFFNNHNQNLTDDNGETNETE